MLIDFSVTKLVERGGVVHFVGATSDDRVDLYNTRCTQELFQSWLSNAIEMGNPWLTVSHYPKEIGYVGDITEMWIENQYFKIAGVFLDTPLAQAAALSLRNDLTGKIRLSSGFVPTNRRVEDGGVTAFTAGYLQHSALTTQPANLGAYVNATIDRNSARFYDTAEIVGEEFALDLEKQYADYLIENSGGQIEIPKNLSQWERITQMDLLVRNLLGPLAKNHYMPIVCEGDTCAITGEQGTLVVSTDCLDTDLLSVDDPLILSWARALLQRSDYSFLSNLPDKELNLLLRDDEDARLELLTVSPPGLTEVTDEEVVSLHWRAHQVYAQVAEDRQFENLTMDKLMQAHKFLSAEMMRRGIYHAGGGELDEVATRFVPEWLEEKRESIILVPGYVGLGGKSIQDTESANVEVIIHQEAIDTNTEAKITSGFLQLDKTPEFSYEPNKLGDQIPMWDLALVPVKHNTIELRETAAPVPSRNPTRPDFIKDMAIILNQIEGMAVMEMGCGDGHGVAVLTDGGYNAIGIDTNEAAVEYCHQLGIHALQIDSAGTDFEDACADTVYSMHLLEYHEDPQAVIVESMRLAGTKAIHLVELGAKWETEEDLKIAFPDCVIETVENNTVLVVAKSVGEQRTQNYKLGQGDSYSRWTNLRSFVLDWATDFIDKGVPLVVEQQYTAHRVALHYEGEPIIKLEYANRDHSKQFPDLTAELESLGKSITLEGYLCVVDRAGYPVVHTDWGNDEAPMNFTTADDIEVTMVVPVTDILFYDGKDLRSKPWRERRQILERVLADCNILVPSAATITRSRTAFTRTLQGTSARPNSRGVVVKSVEHKYNGSNDSAILRHTTDKPKASEPTSVNFSFEEGMKGTGVIQTHEHKLSKDQALLLGRSFSLLSDIEMSPVDLVKLNELAEVDWTTLVARGNVAGIRKALANIDRSSLTRPHRRALIKVEPIAITTEIRLRPHDADWWEGATSVVSQSQFDTPNIFTRYQLTKERNTELSWLQVASNKPAVFSPGTKGATEGYWGRISTIDRVRWEAGKQLPHYREFKLAGKKLNGTYAFRSVPTGDGWRVWTFDKID